MESKIGKKYGGRRLWNSVIKKSEHRSVMCAIRCGSLDGLLHRIFIAISFLKNYIYLTFVFSTYEFLKFIFFALIIYK